MLRNIKRSFESIEEFREYLDTVDTQCEFINKCSLKDWSVDQSGTLLMNFAQKSFPVRETALDSILSRYKVNGDAFRDERTSDETLAKIFNTLNYMCNDMLKIMITDGAVNSVNTSVYSHIPMTEILDESAEVIGTFYKGDVRCNILHSYANTYIKFYTDKYFTFNGKKRKLIITLSNSENGQGSVRYGAFIGNGMLPIMDDICIVHKNDANIQKVQTAVDSLEKVVTQAVSALCLLEVIELSSPVTAVKDLGKQIGLPKMYINNVVANIEVATNLGRQQKFTAAEIYDLFGEAIMEGRESELIQERYKNNLLKLISMDWSKYSK